MTKRWKLGVLSVSAIVALALGADVCLRLDRASGPPIHDLTELRPLTAAFNAKPSGPRLLVLLSPT